MSVNKLTLDRAYIVTVLKGLTYDDIRSTLYCGQPWHWTDVKLTVKPVLSRWLKWGYKKCKIKINPKETFLLSKWLEILENSILGNQNRTF